jgi:hypothetical protein
MNPTWGGPAPPRGRERAFQRSRTKKPGVPTMFEVESGLGLAIFGRLARAHARHRVCETHKKQFWDSHKKICISVHFAIGNVTRIWGNEKNKTIENRG